MARLSCWSALAIVLVAGCSRGSPSPAPSAGATLGNGPPAWAFPLDPPEPAAADDEAGVRTLPGSTASFSPRALGDLFTAPDWYPGDHAPMPPLAAHGTPPSEYACGYCHLPNGFGRPENAPLAGLPVAYILQQVRDFASGARTTSVPSRVPPTLMGKLSVSAAADPRLEEAAKYFASIPWTSTTKVVEADAVPKTEAHAWVLRKAASGGTEPIGERIVELADDVARFELRDPRTTFTAYVPTGSLAKGEALARTGGGKTMPCGNCHGLHFEGAAAGPPLAGRSPTYLARQLYDFKSGARNGPGAALMKSVVMNLTAADVVALCAYAASRKP